MHRITFAAFGDADHLKIEDVQSQHAGPGQIVVEVEAAGVNYLDVYQRNGINPVALPWTPGLEGVGRVREVSEGAGSLKTGQRVAWVNVRGSYASELVLPVDQAIVVPDAFTASQCLLFQPLTAQYLATEYRQIRPGDIALVHAAAGGVGGMLVQWLKHFGARVIGTVSSDAKAATARSLGADDVVNLGRDYAFADELRALTKGRGVDIAFDSVCAATFAATVDALAAGGTAVSFGGASGPAPAIAPGQLIPRCARIAGGSLFTYIADPGELQRRAAAVIEGVSSGWLKINDGASYELANAADAHRAIESRGTQGKLYLTSAASHVGA